MSLERFDAWLDMRGPVAVVVQERLHPVQGPDSVFFPPTFAPPEGSKDAPGYVIDETAAGRVALVDTVGSQANRIEPLFKQSPYSELVPKATVKIGAREIYLLDAGHRAADAVVRFSDKWSVLRDAFLAIRDSADASALASLAPTSLVFGVWDSRDTQVKLPRIVGSTIRAWQVDRLTRSAQFFAATEKEDTDGLASQDFLSAVGLDDAPAGRTSGGVIARGEIRREATLNLVALRALSAGRDADRTRALQRYILGLSLVGILAPSAPFLREGCLLVPADDTASPQLVQRNGQRVPADVDEDAALEYARLAANAFSVGPDWSATFEKDSVKKAADKKKEDKAKKVK